MEETVNTGVQTSTALSIFHALGLLKNLDASTGAQENNQEIRSVVFFFVFKDVTWCHSFTLYHRQCEIHFEAGKEGENNIYNTDHEFMICKSNHMIQIMEGAQINVLRWILPIQYPRSKIAFTINCKFNQKKST